MELLYRNMQDFGILDNRTCRVEVVLQWDLYVYLITYLNIVDFLME